MYCTTLMYFLYLLGVNKCYGYGYGYIPLRRCNFCEFVFKTLPVRPKYPAETNNFYRPPEVALRPKHPKCKSEKRIHFSFFLLHFWKRKRNSFFVFRSQIWKGKTKKEFVIRFSFANLKTKKEKTVYTRTLIDSGVYLWTSVFVQ